MGLPFTAAIVGLGKIGQSLDEGLNASAYCLTHAQALNSHSDFKLIGGVDPDAGARGRFSLRFKVGAFSQFADLAQNQKLDLVVVAGPTKSNFETFKQVLSFRPRMILMEKPLGENLQQAREMLAMARASKVDLAVNFMRRAEPGVLKMKELIQKQEIGAIEKVILTYSKGLLNNGSHFIDLMRFLLGESSHHQILGSVCESFEGDCEPDFAIQFGRTPVFFLSAREKNFSVRDIEFIGSRGGVRYLRGGQKIFQHDVVESPLFKGYRFLSIEGKEIPSQLDRVQYFVADQIAKFLRSEGPLSFSAEEALKTMEDVERIKGLCQVH